MDISVNFEDDYLAVIEKPAGITVNRSENDRENTLEDWSQDKLGLKLLERAGIVHRLDKETSGLIIIAKDGESLHKLQQQFAEREVKKKYSALVHGLLKGTNGSLTVSAPISRLPWNRRKFGIVPDGREAVTEIAILDYYERKNKDYTYIEAKPQTGRTHQIRVHLKYLGHPIVADPLYAGRKVFRQDIKIFLRLFLHASYLSFKHPLTDKVLEFNSPLPHDLAESLKILEKK